jgi:hypothetical protein
VANVEDQRLAQQRQRADGEQRREHLVGLLELALEARAASAGADVAANDRRRALVQPLGDFGQLDPDLVAGQLPCLGGLGQ